MTTKPTPSENLSLQDKLRQKFFEEFMTTGRERTAASQAAVSADDAKTLVHEMHLLAGEGSMLGFADVGALARGVENLAKEWAAGDASKRVRCGRDLRLIVKALDELAREGSEGPNPELHRDASQSSQTDGAIRVLVVDDSELVGAEIREALEAQDIKTRTAQTLDSAVHLAEALRPSVLIVDANIPGVSTKELLAKLRASSPLSKVYLVSGLSAGELEALSTEVAADGYFCKQEGLTALVDGILGTIKSTSA